MHPGAQQTFGLGTVVSPGGTAVPSKTSILVEGRGVFAKVKMRFEFTPPLEAEALFLLEKPSDAVASAILLHGAPLQPQAKRDQPRALPREQMQALEEALSVPSSHLLVLEPGTERPLSELTVEFTLAVDLQWHRGAFLFRSPEGLREVDFEGRWELSGLPGAGLAFSGAASACRLQTLEASRYRWSEPLQVGTDQPAAMEFSLDEKKAASIAVFSPSSPAGEEATGCAAVAVVAPVRPQAARDPIRLAIVVELRNPQDGLLIRSLVERVVGLLKPQDEFSVFLVGTDEPAPLVPWGTAETMSDSLLGRLLEPSVVGRAPDLWGNVARLGPQLRLASHVLLASSGAPTYPGKGLLATAPVFIFATGRRPFKSQLESLSERSGGFLMEGHADTLETLLERLRIRLSPPLLSDFKLEGWALEQLRPAGATQVYTDQPTLVFGLYSGLLPKTVTLSGQSPSRQKLAQRVKVETLEEIDLMPIYWDRVARWDGETEPMDHWTGGEGSVCNVSHAEALRLFYEALPEAAPAFGNEPTVTDSGAVLAISFEPLGEAGGQEILLGAPSLVEEPSFLSADSQDVFEGVAEPTLAEESDLFFAPSAAFVTSDDEPFGQPSGELATSWEGPEAEPDLFLDSAELLATPAPGLAEPANESQESGDEGNGKRRLGSWRSRSESSESTAPAPAPELGPRPVVEGWHSGWVEAFRGMTDDAAQAWLASCSIDRLGLALSLLPEAEVEEVLARLEPVRRRAVRGQVAWGRLLESYECEEADRVLALDLTHSTIG